MFGEGERELKIMGHIIQVLWPLASGRLDQATDMGSGAPEKLKEQVAALVQLPEEAKQLLKEIVAAPLPPGLGGAAPKDFEWLVRQHESLARRVGLLEVENAKRTRGT